MSSDDLDNLYRQRLGVLSQGRLWAMHCTRSICCLLYLPI